MEGWPSGLRRTPGERVHRKVSRVRIPLPPPTSLANFSPFSAHLKTTPIFPRLVREESDYGPGFGEIFRLHSGPVWPVFSGALLGSPFSAFGMRQAVAP